MAGYGASFDGARWASTAQSAALSLGGGQLTLAAWLYPAEPGHERYDTWPQGVLGYHSGEADGYPTLQRYGNKVRFGFGAVTATGNAWKRVHQQRRRPDPEHLEPRGGHVRPGHAHGRLSTSTASCASRTAPPSAGVTGLVPNATPTIDIGRSGDLTSVKVSLPNVCDNGEYNWRNCSEARRVVLHAQWTASAARSRTYMPVDFYRECNRLLPHQGHGADVGRRQ